MLQTRHLPAIVMAGPSGTDALFSAWFGSNESVFGLSRASWGLRALVEACAGSTNAAPSVWVPDFFCNQANVLLKDHARIMFYPVAENLAPDWERCAHLGTTLPPDIFVLVHYFGRPSPSDAARAFCDRYGAVLVEDAAHVFAPGPGIGQAGDAVIWSFYKHFPAPDGGLLVVRPTSRLKPDMVETVIARWSGGAPKASNWLAKRLIQYALPSLGGRALRAAPSFDDDPHATDLPFTPQLSGLARRLLSSQLNDAPAIAVRRRANDAALRALFRQVDSLTPLLEEADTSWAPYRTVLRARDPYQARLWYDRILASGNIVETWPDLAPEIRANPDAYPVAVTLRSTILSLPIHADRRPEELVRSYASALG